MSARNRSLVAVVAAVAVAAVAGGGLLASRLGPQVEIGTAAPLTATPAAMSKLPTKVALDATRLQRGRAPQVAYLRGRTVQGGPGRPVRIPGTTEIIAVGRLWDITLTVQLRSVTDSSLVMIDSEGKQVNQIKGVDSLSISSDGQAAAYASGGRFAPTGRRGGTVFLQLPGTTPTFKLARPEAQDLEVMSVIGHSVYFRSGRGDGATWDLYRWQVDQHSVSKLDKVRSPIALSTSGTVAAGLAVFTDSGMCTVLTDLVASRQRWRTCQYQVTRFGPSDSFVLAIPPGSEPYGDVLTAVLDSKTGDLLREWDARSIRGAVAEDDEYVLLQWHDQPTPGSRSALVRCAVSTGRCELATPLSSEPLLLGS
ncbi:MAG TPA: hypothetical protein VGD34_05215 [Kribbella sp.]